MLRSLKIGSALFAVASTAAFGLAIATPASADDVGIQAQVGTSWTDDNMTQDPRALDDTVLNTCLPIGHVSEAAQNGSSNRTIRLYSGLLACQNNNPLVTLNPGASSFAFSGATFFRVT